MPQTYKLYLATLTLAIAAFNLSGVNGDIYNGPTSLKEKSFDELIINGPAYLDDVKVEKLTVHGPLEFKKLEVKGVATVTGPTKGKESTFNALSIKGPFKAKDVTIESLEVAGPVKLLQFTIKGKTVVKGPLKAWDGSFQDLTAGPSRHSWSRSTPSVILHNVKAKNIVIREEHGHEILMLSGNTKISGTIDFELKQGKVEKGEKKSDLKGAKEAAPLRDKDAKAAKDSAH